MEKRHYVLALIVCFGVLMVLLISAGMDYVAWKDNQQIDKAGNPYFDDYHLERYKVQAVESHVLGTGLGLTIELGLIAWWINKYSRV